jgi:uncharacterized delta-60 repeat protein
MLSIFRRYRRHLSLARGYVQCLFTRLILPLTFFCRTAAGLTLGLIVCVAQLQAAPGDLDTTFNPNFLVPGFSGGGGNLSSSGKLMQIRPDGKIVLAGGYDPQAPGVLFQEIWLTVSRLNADGTVDNSFNGVLSSPFILDDASRINLPKSLHLLPDGRLLIASRCWITDTGVSVDYKFCLVRTDELGNPDPTFGNNGFVIQRVSPGNSDLESAVVQPDGKVIAVGTCWSTNTLATKVDQACLARFLSNGSLDTSFATGGIFQQSLTTRDKLNHAALQIDGSIAILGSCAGDECVVRFTPSGALDTSFNSTGIRNISFAGHSFSGVDLAISPDGRILIAGQCSGAGYSYFCIAKLNANGTPVTAFGNAGPGRTVISATPFAQNKAASIRVQSDGKILMSGSCDNTLCVARFFDDGTLDKAFGAEGIASVTALPTYYELLNSEVTIDRNGKILARGTCIYDDALGVRQTASCTARLEGSTTAARVCNLDIDGDGQVFSSTDALIMSRAAAKLTGGAVIGGITFPANATRNSWPLVRDYLVRQCGMSLVP